MTIKTVTMTPDEWALVPENPVQRDTIRHATTSSRPGGHLSKYHESHSLVSMCATPDEKKIWKLDGHSRDWLWINELLDKPKELTVNVYTVKNKQACEDLYYHFDSAQATENKRDKLFGAFRRYGFVPKHGILMMNCGVMSAIEYTVFPAKWADLKNLPFTDMVKPWVDTLEIFDKSGEYTNHQLFRSAVMTAALMTVRRDGSGGVEFWQGYHDDIGRKGSATCDGIFAARDLFNTFQHEQRQRWGRHVHRAYVPYFLKCYDNWFDGKRMTRFASIEGKTKFPKNMMNVREWWEEYIGELDHPQIRTENALKLQKKKATSTKATEAGQTELAL